MRGPVMWTTEGLRASTLVSLITSPRPLAAASFNSEEESCLLIIGQYLFTARVRDVRLQI